MNEHEALLISRTAALLARTSVEVEKKLVADPNAFFRGLMLDLGLAPPDGFHAHVVKAGSGIPDEESLDEQTRSVYVLRRDASVEHIVIPPKIGGAGVAQVSTASGGKCNSCGICIIYEP